MGLWASGLGFLVRSVQDLSEEKETREYYGNWSLKGVEGAVGGVGIELGLFMSCSK